MGTWSLPLMYHTDHKSHILVTAHWTDHLSHIYLQIRLSFLHFSVVWDHCLTSPVHFLCINEKDLLSLWFKGWDLKPQNIWAKCFSCTISHLMSYQPIKLRKINISILVWQMRMVRQSFPLLYTIHLTEDEKWLVGFGIQTHFYHLLILEYLVYRLKSPICAFLSAK